MRVRWRQFQGGWWPMGVPELAPAKTLRRATGVHPIKSHTLRSRPGSTVLFALTAHSLYRFADVRFQGVGTELFRDGVDIKSGLNGNKLSFMRMPPTISVVDSLFVAGGGTLFKVDSAGAVTKWGIIAPTTNPAANDNGVGVMAVGTYKYFITFLNSTTGHRSNANPDAATVTIIANRQVQLTAIPVSADAQVSAREVWRTTVGGTSFFKLATIANNVDTTYNDNALDSALDSTELPTDNDPPQAYFNKTTGPHYGRAFWTAIDNDGEHGRVYYSPSGRAESVSGFIDVTSDDDHTQAAVVWNGSVWVFSEKLLTQVIGTTEPFTWKEVQGAPGTVNPETICVTPYGIVYEAVDGVYVFNGSVSKLVAFDAVGLIFRGESLEGVGPMSATTHAYGRSEYVISDGTITMALNLSDGTWRNVGQGYTALYYESDTGKMIGSSAGYVSMIEEVGGVAPLELLSFEIEPPAALSDVKKVGLTQRVYVEMDTQGQWVLPTLYVDAVAYVLPQFQTTTRETVEFPKLVSGRLFSVRLTANPATPAVMMVYGIEMDIDVGAEPITPTPVLGSKTGVVPVTQAQAAV